MILLVIELVITPVFARAEVAPAAPSTSAAQQTPAKDSPPTSKFVSDQLTIMLRSGPSNKHKIIRALTTATKVQVLETQGKYDHVRTRSGVEGWVLNQHLTDKPLAKHQLAEASQKLSNLQKKHNELREQISQLKDNYNKLKEQNRVLDKSNTQMEAELAHIRNIAAQPLKLSNEKKELSAQTETLENQVLTLKDELQTIRNSTQKQWFLTGAAVVLFGILIGLTIPKMRRRRSTDWGSL